MASTYSNIGIELIGAYEQEDAWGNTANDNFGYFDEAIDGVISLALTTTTETLTTPDGSSGETLATGGRHKVIRFTGTPGGTCTITVAPDDMQKVYMIYNNTDQSVIIKQGSAGSTVTILSGNKNIVYCDGAGATNGAVIEIGYNHPTFNGDDISIATTALTGATIFDDIDLVVTTDTNGHVTAASGAVSTRELTPANIGAQAAGTYNTIIGTDTDLNTSGAQVIDIISLTDGVINSAITTRNLTAGDIGAQAAGTYNTIIGTDSDINTSGSTIIDNIYVTDGVITSMGTRVLTRGDLGAGACDATYAQTTTPQEVTTTYITYESIAMTVATGAEVLIVFTGEFYATAITVLYFRLSRDALAIGVEVSASIISGKVGAMAVSDLDTPGSGTFTYHLKVDALASASVYMSSGNLSLVEIDT